jgi:hypothetical protein
MISTHCSTSWPQLNCLLPPYVCSAGNPPRNAVMDPSQYPFNLPGQCILQISSILPPYSANLPHILSGPAVPPASKPRQMAASNNPWRIPQPPLLNARAGLGDASLFSTSLPLLPHEKCMCAASHLLNALAYYVLMCFAIGWVLKFSSFLVSTYVSGCLRDNNAKG